MQKSHQSCAEILEQSMGARNWEGTRLSYDRTGPLAYVTCMAGRYDNPTYSYSVPSCHILFWNSSTGFDPSILRHNEIWGAADKAVLNKVHSKNSPV